MIKPMAEAFILTLMDLDMKGSGKTTNNMGLVLKDGQMEHNMKASTLKERSMERESSYGRTRARIMENSQTIIFREWASTSGLMEGYTTESGSITRCKVMEHSRGQMVGSM